MNNIGLKQNIEHLEKEYNNNIYSFNYTIYGVLYKQYTLYIVLKSE